MWDTIVGQERAVPLLQLARERPAHAYLLAGPDGSGVLEAAHLLAASLLDDTEPDDLTIDLVKRGVHVDVLDLEPEGTFFLVEQAERVIREALRTPVDSARKVIVLQDVDRMHDAAGNKLLKVIEEPGPHTIFVLTTSRPSDVLETIRSRCQRIDFDVLSDDVIVDALVEAGIAVDEARQLAVHAAGHLQRARDLASSHAHVRAAFVAVPARVDGTGAGAHDAMVEIEAAVEAAVAAKTLSQSEELEALDEANERSGYEGRVAQARKRALVERHKRELTRLRRVLLLEGVTAIESVYRDVLAVPASPRNAGEPLPSIGPSKCARALDACRVAREALLVNEKGALHLLNLFLALPVPGVR